MKKIIILITFIILLTGCEINISTNSSSTYDSSKFEDIIECTRKNVNTGKVIQFYEKQALLLIPISKRNACTPDFNDSDYKYAFVGLMFNYTGYRYFLYVSNNDGYGYDEEYLNRDLSYKMVNENKNLTKIYKDKELLNSPTNIHGEESDDLPTVMAEYETRLLKYDLTEKLEKISN